MTNLLTAEESRLFTEYVNKEQYVQNQAIKEWVPWWREKFDGKPSNLDIIEVEECKGLPEKNLNEYVTYDEYR
jgi:hypothetical protein